MAEVKSRVPGKMIEVNVKVGDVVKAKDILGTMEAMKMKQPINSPVDGTVKEVKFNAGDRIGGGEVMFVVE
jgi:biotin carboxyl carrier protein